MYDETKLTIIINNNNYVNFRSLKALKVLNINYYFANFFFIFNTDILYFSNCINIFIKWMVIESLKHRAQY